MLVSRFFLGRLLLVILLLLSEELSIAQESTKTERPNSTTPNAVKDRDPTGSQGVASGQGTNVLEPGQSQASNPTAGLGFPLPEKLSGVLGGPGAVPDAVYLRNEKGEAIFIPDVRYEEFENYLRSSSNGNRIAPPKAIIDRMSIEGSVRDGVANLAIKLTLDLIDRKSKRIQIPIALRNMNLADSPKSFGGKANFLTPRPNHEGYFWWIEPKEEEVEKSDLDKVAYTIEFPVVQKIEQTATQSTLTLDLPEAPTDIRIRLFTDTVDGPASKMNVQWLGATGELFKTDADEKSIMSSIKGRGGVASLVWSQGVATNDLAAIEVDSLTRLVKQTDRLSFDATTRLRMKIDNRLGPRDLIVQLPDGAKWLPSPTSSAISNWSLSNYSPPANGNNSTDEYATNRTNDGASKKSLLLLRMLERGRSFNEEISINWQWAVDDKAGDNLIITPVTVNGVQRHEGRIGIVLPQSQRFTWTPSNFFYPVSRNAASDNPQSTEYEFRFVQQNAALTATLNSIPIKSELRTDAVVRFEKKQANWEIVYQLLGDTTNLQSIEIGTEQSTVDRIELLDSKEAIPIERLSSTLVSIPIAELLKVRAKTLVSPMTEGMSAIRFKFFANQSISPDGELDLTVPELRQVNADGRKLTQHGAGTLMILPGNWRYRTGNVRLESMSMVEDIGLDKLASLTLSEQKGSKQLYQFSETGTIPSWSSAISPIETSFVGDIQTTVLIRQENWQIIRKWNVGIEGEIPDHVAWRIPTRLITSDKSYKNAKITPFNFPVDSTTLPAKGLIESATPNDSLKSAINRRPYASSILLKVNGRPVVAQMVPDENKNSDQCTIEFIESAIPKVSQFEMTITGVWLTPSIGADVKTNASTNSPDAVVDQTEPAEASGRTGGLLGQYDLPLPKLLGERVSLNSQDANVAVVKNLDCQFAKSSVITRLDRGDDQLTQLAIERDEEILSVNLDTNESIAPPQLDIERVWLQSIHNQSQTRYRVAYRMRSVAPSMVVELPDRWVEDRVEAFVDGVRINLLRSQEPGIVKLSMPINSSAIDRKFHAIEFWYWDDSPARWFGELNSDIPKFVNASVRSPIIWQILTPTDEYLWEASNEFFRDSRWTWENLFGRKNLTSSTAELEQALGASPQPPIGIATNEYLFSGLAETGGLSKVGTDRQIQSKVSEATISKMNLTLMPTRSKTMKVYLISRLLLWMPVAAFVLLLFAFWSNFTSLRRVWGIAAVSAMLAIVILVAPDLATVLMQSALISLGGVVSICCARWVMDSRVRRRQLFSNRSSSQIPNRVNKRATAIEPYGSTAERITALQQKDQHRTTRSITVDDAATEPQDDEIALEST